MQHETSKLVVWLLIIAVLILIVSFIPRFLNGVPEVSQTAQPYVPGAPSREVVEMLAKSNGFSVLISYTDGGFESSNVTLTVGQTVRFTNNSSHDLWVASDAAKSPAYPGSSDCGSSALDSCHVLKPHDFWEFTFNKKGTWNFVNNLDKTKTGTVHVIAE